MQTQPTTKREQTVRSLPAATLFLAGVLSAGAFCACSSGSDSLSDEQQQVRIAPSIAFAQTGIDAQSDALQTKAPVDGSTALTLYFVRADETAAGTYKNYATTALPATRAAGSGATALTFSPSQFYLANGLKTKLAGWYPQATTFTGGIVSWTFDGQQDIMTASGQEGTKTTPMPGFTFNHRLAQLQFFPYADNEHITQSWGKIKSIEVLSQANQASYTLTDEAITFGGSGSFAAGIPAEGVTLATSRNNALMVGNAVMIAPQSTDSYELTLSINTEKQGSKTVKITRKLEAGIPYKIFLRFAQLEMIVTPEVTIGEWIPGYDTSIKTDPVTEPDIDIDNWETGSNEEADY